MTFRPTEKERLQKAVIVHVLQTMQNNAWSFHVAWGSQSIKIDIGKSFDKSISIDKLILNDIEINRSINKNRYSHTHKV